MDIEAERHQASVACPHCGGSIDLVDGEYAASKLGITATLFRTWLSRGRLRPLAEKRLGHLVGNVWLRNEVDHEVEAAAAAGITKKSGPGRPRRST